MIQRLVLTFATAGSLIGLAVVYSIAMRPVIVIPAAPKPEVEQTEFTEFQRPAEFVRIATRHVPSQPWAAESKYMLHAEQAFLYTQSWSRDESSGKRVKFEPFAMVWLSTNKEGKEQAVSIVSESAQLEFASAFDEKNPNPGRVVGAVLSGEVQISGPDGLAIVGKNFIFDESGLSLYTTNPVRFAFQSNSGWASEMRMKLIPAEGLPGTDRPHVYGVESVRLIGRQSDIKLKFQLPQGDEVRPVDVRCAGELEYTVDTHTAVLSTDVRVWTGKDKQYDRLNCETLTLQFTPKTVKATDQSKPVLNKPGNDDYQKLETDLQFSWLEALASDDRSKTVKIFSALNGIEAQMTRLTYDAETQSLSMSSDIASKPVSIFRNHSQLLAPEIEAQLRLGEPNPLESLDCLGQGELQYVDEKTGRIAFVAKWKKKLSKRLDEESNLDLIELDDDALFKQPDRKSGLLADQIKIWLLPLAFGLPKPGEKTDAATTPEPEPKRLLAQGDVAFRSPQLQIDQTRELDIRFDEEPAATPTIGDRRLRSSLKPSVLTAVSRDVGQSQSSNPSIMTPRSRPRSGQVGFASIPAIPDGTLGPPVRIPQQDSANPIVILAKRIGVRLKRIPGRQEPALKEVRAEGRVTITQQRKNGELPMKLEGDRVDVKAESEKREIVHVHGNPALIRDRGLEIEGKNIHLDRGANRAWVNGAGELKLLIPEDRKIPGVETNAQRRLRVRWIESMDFNGQAATFLGAVEAKLGYGTMHCEQMVVEMLKRISFQADSPDAKPDLHFVHCTDNVRFENSSYLEKNVVDIYRGRVGEFRVNCVTGDVEAQGPGEIHAWQRHKKSSGKATRDAIQANRPIAVEVTSWDYTGIQFEGKLEGHFDGQTTGQSTYQLVRVDDRVKVIHGPVNTPGERINPDKLPSRSGTIRCDKLEFVNHPVSEKTAVEFREIMGLGNTEIEGQIDGRYFTASADEASYDGSNGNYTLRGHGRHSASVSGDMVSGTGQRIEFNPDPKINSIRVSHASEARQQ